VTKEQITNLEIESPADTKGVIPLSICGEGSNWELNGQVISISNGTFTVAGGQKLIFRLS
jgi:hypothetical protein